MSDRFANDRRFDDDREFQLGASGRRDPNAEGTPVEKSAANAVNVFADTPDLSTDDDGRSGDDPLDRLRRILDLLPHAAAGDEDAQQKIIDIEEGGDDVDTSKSVIKNRRKGRRSTYPPGTFDDI